MSPPSRGHIWLGFSEALPSIQVTSPDYRLDDNLCVETAVKAVTVVFLIFFFSLSFFYYFFSSSNHLLMACVWQAADGHLVDVLGQADEVVWACAWHFYIIFFGAAPSLH